MSSSIESDDTVAMCENKDATTAAPAVETPTVAAKATVSADDQAPTNNDNNEKKSDDDAEALLRFAEHVGIKVNDDKFLAITVQKNLTTAYVSAIIDVKHRCILPHYPVPDKLTQYTEKRLGPFIVVFNNDLPPTSSTQPTSNAVVDDNPFCCAAVKVDRDRRLDREQLFVDFVAARGSHPGVVFEVKRQINNGPLLSTKYFQLVDNQVTHLDAANKYEQKLHAFKNYKCTVHNLYFAVDLFSASAGNRVGSNRHHMRLNPFSKISPTVLAEMTQTIKEK